MKNVKKYMGLIVLAFLVVTAPVAMAQESTPAPSEPAVVAPPAAAPLPIPVPVVDQPEEKSAASAIEMLSSGDLSLTSLNKGQEAIAVLKTLAEIEKLKAEIAGTRRQREGGGLGGLLPLPPGGDISMDMGSGRDAGGYAVVRIFGSNENFAAALKGSGRVLIAKVGDMLPGPERAKVDSISMLGVVVKGSSGKYTLPFVESSELTGATFIPTAEGR